MGLPDAAALHLRPSPSRRCIRLGEGTARTGLGISAETTVQRLVVGDQQLPPTGPYTICSGGELLCRITYDIFGLVGELLFNGFDGLGD